MDFSMKKDSPAFLSDYMEGKLYSFVHLTPLLGCIQAAEQVVSIEHIPEGVKR